MKKNFRKALAIVLSSLMVMGVTACSGSSSSESGEDKTVIGIVQMADNGAFTDMREVFIAQMKAQGFDDTNTEFVYKNAQGDASNLNTICQQMVSDNVDLVAAIATPSAQAIFLDIQSLLQIDLSHLLHFKELYI